MSTQQERAAKVRAEKLAEIEQRKKDGSLVVRAMTDAEREKYPKLPPPPPKPRRWG